MAVAGRSTLPQQTAPSASGNQFLASFLLVAEDASCTRLERSVAPGKEVGLLLLRLAAARRPQRDRGGLLSGPTLRRPTPIATTPLLFTMQLGVEGVAMSMRLNA